MTGPHLGPYRNSTDTLDNCYSAFRIGRRAMMYRYVLRYQPSPTAVLARRGITLLPLLDRFSSQWLTGTKRDMGNEQGKRDMETLAQDQATNTQVRALPDLGTLSEVERNELFRRRALLGELADKVRVSNAILARRAQEVGVSSRTLRRFHTRYRRYGLMGLVSGTSSRAARASQGERGGKGGNGRKGTHYTISRHMVEVVESLRLTHRDAPIRYIHELTSQHASVTSEKAPSMFQVRSICAQIPAAVRLLADAREGEFRNRYRITYPIRHDPHRIVWQVDHKAPLHVLVKDLRAPSHRTASGEVRPFLTLVVDSASRLIMTGLFSYDAPTRFTVAAAIRDAILTNERKPFGGVPDEIWIDNGKDLIARHVYQLAEGLGIKLVPGPPHQPQIRGIVERLHETLDTRLWSTLPGYVGPNAVRRNPKAKAGLTIAQLDEHFRVFVERYHQEVHSETEQTPLAFWQEHATPLPVDKHLLRLLDVLLKEPANRRVLKEGIKYAGERYWHPELALFVGEDVVVRAAPCYTAPDEIEVFFEGQWRCTAFAFTSHKGQSLERQVVVEAQRRQRAYARSRIKAAREMLQSASSTTLTTSSISTTSTTLSGLPPLPALPATSPSTASTASTPNQQGRRQATFAIEALDTLDALNMSPTLPADPAASAASAAHQPDLFDFLVAQQAEQAQEPDHNNWK